MSYNWKCCSFYPNNFDASALLRHPSPRAPLPPRISLSIALPVTSQTNIRVKSACKIFVKFVLLPPFGQWAYGESRVQKNLVSTREHPAANKIRDPCAYKNRVKPACI